MMMLPCLRTIMGPVSLSRVVSLPCGRLKGCSCTFPILRPTCTAPPVFREPQQWASSSEVVSISLPGFYLISYRGEASPALGGMGGLQTCVRNVEQMSSLAKIPAPPISEAVLRLPHLFDARAEVML